MEFVAGRSLAEVVRQGPLAAPRAAALVRQAALGMSAAHAAGIIHGDLKPENLLVTGDDTVKITDFGLARREVKGGPTAETLVWQEAAAGLSGTPSYMAPELLEGERAAPASDVFALGLVLYELLTGRRAVDGANVLPRRRRAGPLPRPARTHALPRPDLPPVDVSDRRTTGVALKSKHERQMSNERQRPQG
jgi:serine/threonine-protein kinase